MKIVTASNGKKKIKISRNEWKEIGKKAGWMKKAVQSLVPGQSLGGGQEVQYINQIETDPDIEAKQYLQPIMDALQKGQISQAVLGYIANAISQADQSDAAANYRGNAQPQQAQPQQA